MFLNLDCENNNLIITNDVIKDILKNGPVVTAEDYVFKINITHNCCTVFPEVEIAYNTNTPVDIIESSYELVNHPEHGDSILLYGSDFNNFQDGIYSVIITIELVDESVELVLQESYCSLLTCELNCKLSEYIEGLLKEDKLALDVVLYHYALIDSQECNCHCEEQCELYKKLISLISDKNCRSC